MGMKWINKDKDTPKNTVTGLFQMKILIQSLKVC